MDKRIRSPNYPALSLSDAIDKVQAVYRAQHKHAAPRDVVVKGMGYAGLNGASATAVSALMKYGLLDREGEELRVSDRAMRIIAPHSPDERVTAIREAALQPTLFQELMEKFPDRMPSEELLKNYLIRKGFAPAALSAVIAAYKDTSEMVEREGGGYDSARTQQLEEPQMQIAVSQSPAPPVRAAPSPAHGLALGDADERIVSRYDFEDGQYVRIMASREIDTEEALDMVETMIALKRKELDRKKRMASVARQENISDIENEEN